MRDAAPQATAPTLPGESLGSNPGGSAPEVLLAREAPFDRCAESDARLLPAEPAQVVGIVPRDVGDPPADVPPEVHCRPVVRRVGCPSPRDRPCAGRTRVGHVLHIRRTGGTGVLVEGPPFTCLQLVMREIDLRHPGQIGLGSIGVIPSCQQSVCGSDRLFIRGRVDSQHPVGIHAVRNPSHPARDKLLRSSSRPAARAVQ